MLVKSKETRNHVADLEETLAVLRKYRLKLNPGKCEIGVRGGSFVRFMVTQIGIEANPFKIKPIFDMKAPTNINEQVFGGLKKYLAGLPLLVKPSQGDTLFLYLSTTPQAVSSILVCKDEEKQMPIYYVSKVLNGEEGRYMPIEKMALALVITARRLHSYFLSHPIGVKINLPLKQTLGKPDTSGWLVKWVVELSEYDISYLLRTTIKAQALADLSLKWQEYPWRIPPR
ncbi:UNVERIFIED_CONTAM: hypothetical protein Sradi_3262900 [Sesamum radiatum]|uniref:Reverse transcriptase/retrotransposon-derived protein RNase H-like domain-containing protein n=1 Tax=Sesamum radiatum TaxID=300843 RepID=A0AAW2R0E3_SESRA